MRLAHSFSPSGMTSSPRIGCSCFHTLPSLSHTEKSHRLELLLAEAIQLLLVIYRGIEAWTARWHASISSTFLVRTYHCVGWFKERYILVFRIRRWAPISKNFSFTLQRWVISGISTAVTWVASSSLASSTLWTSASVVHGLGISDIYLPGRVVLAPFCTPIPEILVTGPYKISLTG